MYLVVSFCNTGLPKETPNICKINVTTQEVTWLPTGEDPKGVTGLAVKDGVELFFINQNGTLGAIDLENGEKVYEENIKAFDPHSLLWKGGVLFMVNSGRDRVAKLEFRNDKVFRRDLKWAVSSVEKDTVHLNCLALNKKGQLHVSMFGPKEGVGWTTSKSGRIFNIDTQQYLDWGYLYHPHSIKFYDDDLYVCESNAFNIKKNNEVFLQFERGYTRGFDMYGGYFAVGFSSGRNTSKSTGETNDSVDTETLCKVQFYKTDGKKMIWEMDFSQFGKKEIYDIIILP